MGGEADGPKCLTLQESLWLLERDEGWGRDWEARWEWYNKQGNSEGAGPRVGNDSGGEVRGSGTQCEGKSQWNVLVDIYVVVHKVLISQEKRVTLQGMHRYCQWLIDLE